MTTTLAPLTLKAEAGATPITEEQFLAYLGPLEDSRGALRTMGPWSLPVTFRAPTVTMVFNSLGWSETITLYGTRTMGKLKEAGYHLEGRVSIHGKTVSAFTSSQLWQLPDGRLIKTAVIHARTAKL